MPKRKQRDEKPQEEKESKQQAQNDGNPEHKPDPIVRVLAYSSGVVAAAVGLHIRFFNCKDKQPAEMDAAQAHTGAVRSLALSPDGAMLLSGSDDKSCKLWDTSARKCIATWRMHKKLSAVAFSRDGKHALFADKFGDVGVAACGSPAQQQPPSEEPELLLGHLCSIVTSITVSPDNRFVVTTDKDGRVRVSMLPAAPLKGSYEIQTYCLGHDSFVATSTFVNGPEQQGPLLVTGGGDGTVHLWDPVDGKLLDTFVAAHPVGPMTDPQQQQQQQQQHTEAEGGQQEQQQQQQQTGEQQQTGAEQQQQQQQQQLLQTGMKGKLHEGHTKADQPMQQQQEQQQEQQEGGHEGEHEGEQSHARAGKVVSEEDGGADKGADGKGQQGAGEGEEDGDGDEEERAEKRSEKSPTCAAVQHLASSRDGSLVCVVVEGEHELQVLRVDARAKSLTLHQKLNIPEVRYPCQAAWDDIDQLWVVGGPPSDSSIAIHLGVARLEGQQLVPCTKEAMPADALAAMEKRNATEEEQVASGQLVPACNKSLLRRRYFLSSMQDSGLGRNKRPRNDVLENERLAAVRQQQLLQRQQQQQQQQQ
ncbi:hypothetical protein DUNSADRAFT_15070 [Dunaliella salina]|uniref:tRNA (guanine-N(7)-)-methyltransferase non-catalytic subunit n=1 Tax=Dunaliella salina TaxID=3046 RepID=A0ABQ7G644_DUNSA|nr:hypothetical protein DUNSADRAFT_15070 [Dunaliella salina]|eukprot:KAF5830070.1 hypothetical protein DUNSADRAFT_15070 [Dunaliella salina]